MDKSVTDTLRMQRPGLTLQSTVVFSKVHWSLSKAQRIIFTSSVSQCVVITQQALLTFDEGLGPKRQSYLYSVVLEFFLCYVAQAVHIFIFDPQSVKQLNQQLN